MICSCLNFNTSTALMPKPLYLCIFLMAVLPANSQGWVSGCVRDSLTHFPVAKATVINSSMNTRVETDLNGLFKIKLAPNDVLYVVADSYHYDTVRYSILYGDTLNIYL